ncbi:hypothetical protein IWQ60_006971 [Tieghemiomyces parasiticus]|uniref:SEC7 domain-containing protein n=1 Tax=Tieghemiomyces parasiticus TaxID=78921 RepID=A0A9W8DVN2_9FUNG|nr:hypothetical protein IWQ60_006971 [Tieghemiomyces parasiticus]
MPTSHRLTAEAFPARGPPVFRIHSAPDTSPRAHNLGKPHSHPGPASPGRLESSSVPCDGPVLMRSDDAHALSHPHHTAPRLQKSHRQGPPPSRHPPEPQASNGWHEDRYRPPSEPETELNPKRVSHIKRQPAISTKNPRSSYRLSCRPAAPAGSVANPPPQAPRPRPESTAPPPSRSQTRRRRNARRSKTLSIIGQDPAPQQLQDMLMSPLDALIRHFASELAVLGQEAKVRDRPGPVIRKAPGQGPRRVAMADLVQPLLAANRAAVTDSSPPITPSAPDRQGQTAKTPSPSVRSQPREVKGPGKSTPSDDDPDPIPRSPPIPRSRPVQRSQDVFQRLSIYREAQRIDSANGVVDTSLLRRSRSFADFFNVLHEKEQDLARSHSISHTFGHGSPKGPMPNPRFQADQRSGVGRRPGHPVTAAIPNPAPAILAGSPLSPSPPPGSQIERALSVLRTLYKAAPGSEASGGEEPHRAAVSTVRSASLGSARAFRGAGRHETTEQLALSQAPPPITRARSVCVLRAPASPVSQQAEVVVLRGGDVILNPAASPPSYRAPILPRPSVAAPNSTPTTPEAPARALPRHDTGSGASPTLKAEASPLRSPHSSPALSARSIGASPTLSPETAASSEPRFGHFRPPVPQSLVRRRLQFEPMAVLVIAPYGTVPEDRPLSTALHRRSRIFVDNPRSVPTSPTVSPCKSGTTNFVRSTPRAGHRLSTIQTPDTDPPPRLRKQNTRRHPITFYYQPQHAASDGSGGARPSMRDSIQDLNYLSRQSFEQQLLDSVGADTASHLDPSALAMGKARVDQPRPISFFASNDPDLPQALSSRDDQSASTFIIPHSLVSRARKNRFIRREALSMVLLDQVVDLHIEEMQRQASEPTPRIGGLGVPHPEITFLRELGRTAPSDTDRLPTVQTPIATAAESAPALPELPFSASAPSLIDASRPPPPEEDQTFAAVSPSPPPPPKDGDKSAARNRSGSLTFGKPDPPKSAPSPIASTLAAVTKASDNPPTPTLAETVAAAAAAAAAAVAEGLAPTLSPAPVSRPPRQLLFHGPSLQILNSVSAKQCYLLLFTDVLVVARSFRRPTAPGAGIPSGFTLQDMFQVRSVVPLYRAQVHLERHPTSQSPALKPISRTHSEHDYAHLDPTPTVGPAHSSPGRGLWMEPRLRAACRQFEANPLLAILQLLQEKLVPPDAESVAAFLYRTTLLNRKQLGVYLGYGCRHAWRSREPVLTSPYNQHMTREDPHYLRKLAVQHPLGADIERRRRFHHAVTWAFLDRFRYHPLPVDEALRIFLLYIRLPSDPHVIDYLLETFARHWYESVQEAVGSGGVAGEDQPSPASGRTPPRIREFFEPASPELTVKLVYATMTLNSDLHNPLLQRESTPELAYVDFVTKFKVAGAARGRGEPNYDADLSLDDLPLAELSAHHMDQYETEVPSAYLEAVFHRVLTDKLEMAADSKRVMVHFQSAPDCAATVGTGGGATSAPSDGVGTSDISGPLPNALLAFPPSFKNGPLNFSTDLFPNRLIMHGAPSRDLRAYLTSVPLDPSASPAPVADLLRSLTPAAEVWIRIPYPDPSYRVRLYSSSLVCVPEVVDFADSRVQRVAIYPTALGRTTLYFIPRGRNSRVYAGLPVKSVLVEGGFMEHTVTVSLSVSPPPPPATSIPGVDPAKSTGPGTLYHPGHGHSPHAPATKLKRYMFGFSSSVAKERWVQAIQQAVADYHNPPTTSAAQLLPPLGRSASDSDSVADPPRSAGQADISGTSPTSRPLLMASLSSPSIMRSTGNQPLRPPFHRLHSSVSSAPAPSLLSLTTSRQMPHPTTGSVYTSPIQIAEEFLQHIEQAVRQHHQKHPLPLEHSPGQFPPNAIPGTNLIRHICQL